MTRNVRTASAIRHLLSLGYTVIRPAETHAPTPATPATATQTSTSPGGVPAIPTPATGVKA